MELSPVNERIKIFWKQTGMTQHVLAEKIGCKQQDISSAVTNKYRPGLELITGILVAFPEVSSEWLILGSGEMMKSNESNYILGEKLLKTADSEAKTSACKYCIEKDKRIDELTREVKRAEHTIGIQDKLIVEYETQLGKNAKVS